jgi:hypothetical protein
MPYIKEDRRAKIDTHVSEVISALRGLGWNEGDLNYALSRIVGTAFEEEMRYTTIARVTGVLSNVATEFERRCVGPYENAAIVSNGDVPEYSRIEARIEDAKRESIIETLEAK